VNKILLTGKSLTHAQMMQRCLERGGIHTQTIRTPEKLRERGCGYAVQIRNSQLTSAKKLLKECGIHPQKLYLLQENGQFSEVVQ